ncbi:TPA: hypothetical protein N0F65_006911 [Lagenidium giganteum]|uniref:Golgin subfamily A member 7/ERF4 domain-containing protein n=1 Tax=Lagenidium giganteum TaxID=4803 RepID=A0AAV2ZK41_9STRA|nr:TPA: hypothetical protein N0F65_006911 [Lagenidium giganteum]
MAARSEDEQSGRRRLAVLEPTGDVFVNGLASSYDEEFPLYQNASFAQYMTPSEFDAAINKINDALVDHWPCMPCTSFAYGCCICTLGLSFYCATTQVQEAEDRVKFQLQRLNDQSTFKARQIEWKLVRIWYRRASFIEISIAHGAPIPFPDAESPAPSPMEQVKVAASLSESPRTQSMERTAV